MQCRCGLTAGCPACMPNNFIGVGMPDKIDADTLLQWFKDRPGTSYNATIKDVEDAINLLKRITV